MAVMEQILNWVYDGVSKALKVSLSGRTLITDPVATRLTDGTNWAPTDAQGRLIMGLGSASGIAGVGYLNNVDSTSGGNGALFTASGEQRFNGLTWDRVRVANKSVRAAFAAAAAVSIVTPSAGKKINPARLRVIGVPAGEMVDLKDGTTVIKSAKADAQGNALFEWPDGGTAGRSAAINNVYSAAWTTGSTGSAHIDYNEE